MVADRARLRRTRSAATCWKLKTETAAASGTSWNRGASAWRRRSPRRPAGGGAGRGRAGRKRRGRRTSRRCARQLERSPGGARSSVQPRGTRPGRPGSGEERRDAAARAEARGARPTEAARRAAERARWGGGGRPAGSTLAGRWRRCSSASRQAGPRARLGAPRRRCAAGPLARGGDRLGRGEHRLHGVSPRPRAAATASWTARRSVSCESSGWESRSWSTSCSAGGW